MYTLRNDKIQGIEISRDLEFTFDLNLELAHFCKSKGVDGARWGLSMR